jgi:6-phospho-3-hexuloisomerase
MENAVICEITDLAEKIPAAYFQDLHRLIKKAKRVFVTGAGRSGLLGKCFAMRLRHLGIESYATGETICPPAHKGDLLLAVSCSGNKKTLIEPVKAAVNTGAATLCITSSLKNPLARLSGSRIIIPAEKSVQFGNSLFEQAVFVFLETFVEYYRRKEKITTAEMGKRHFNLE